MMTEPLPECTQWFLAFPQSVSQSRTLGATGFFPPGPLNGQQGSSPPSCLSREGRCPWQGATSMDAAGARLPAEADEWMAPPGAPGSQADLLPSISPCVQWGAQQAPCPWGKILSACPWVQRGTGGHVWGREAGWARLHPLNVPCYTYKTQRIQQPAKSARRGDLAGRAPNRKSTHSEHFNSRDPFSRTVRVCS